MTSLSLIRSQHLATRWLVLSAGFVAFYYLAARLGLTVGHDSGLISPVWPSSGLALAAVLWLGPGSWPAIALGAFLVNVLTGLEAGTGDAAQILKFSAIIGFGNALEAVLGAWLTGSRAAARRMLDDPVAVFRFFGIAVLAAAAGSGVGATAACLSQLASWSQFPSLWSMWLVGDALGMLLLTPLLLVWMQARGSAGWFRRGLKPAGYLLGVAGGGLVFLSGTLPAVIAGVGTSLVIGLLFLGGLLFGPRTTTLSVVVLATVAVWGRLQSSGSLAGATTEQALLSLQVFVGVVAIAVAALSASQRRWRRSAQALRDHRHGLQNQLDALSEALVSIDAGGRISGFNAAASELTGWRRSRALGQTLEVVLPELPAPSEDRSGTAVLRSQSLGGQPKTVEYRCLPLTRTPNRSGGRFVVLRDITRQLQLAEQLEYHINFDPLTGLPNRQSFEARLGRALDLAGVSDTCYVLCHLGVDGIKVVNDSAGLMAGDQLLQQLASLFASRIPDRAVLARIGGDEFGLLFEDSTLDSGSKVAESLVAAVADFHFVWDAKRIQVGISAGITFVDGSTADAAEALAQADVARYTARDTGGGRVCAYNASDDESRWRHREIERAASLRHAVDHDRLLLYCQPIVALRPQPGEAQHFEVLVRLRGDQGEIIPAAEFMPAAERFGIAPTIDRWVVRRVLRDCNALLSSLPQVQLSVNLSGLSLADQSLTEFVLAELLASGVPAERLCFEVTETAAIHNLSNATRFIEAVRQRGGRVSLDDFGSGLSSFGYLRSLSVDYLKVDGGIVRHIADSPADLSILKAIADIATALDIRTVAEYVHNRPVLQCLREIGIDYAQGSYVGEPIPIEEIPRHLTRTSLAG